MTNVQAQMSRASVFPEMRSFNPAVISFRPSGNIKLSGSYTGITKDQKVSNLDGNAFVLDDKSETTLTNLNLFRGGKGGEA